MIDSLPSIYFYLPKSDWRDDLPQSTDAVWKNWEYGVYSWTLQTYLRLQADGFPCQLVDSLPEEGIMIAHLQSLPIDLIPNSKSLFICLLADKGRHPYAQIHVVQNPQQIKPRILGDRLLLPGKNIYIPHWTQPGLIPRDLQRGDRFENVAFFGLEINLAPEFREQYWHQQLQDLGLNWQIISSDRWNDYSDVDVVVAVRNFHTPAYAWDYKPPTKLFNAWQAGVPAILGCESAYQAEGTNGIDYLEVTSVKDTLAKLKLLHDNLQLRQKIVENGKLRSEETTPQALIARWHKFIVETAVPYYDYWCNAPHLERQKFINLRRLAIHTRNQRQNIQKLRNQLGIRTRLRSLFQS